MNIRKGHIYLTDSEHSKTHDLMGTDLNCGHCVIPRIKRAKYFQEVYCPVCRKKTFVIGDSIYNDGFITANLLEPTSKG